MSTLALTGLVVFAVVLLLVLVLVVRLHAFVALLVTSLTVAVLGGIPPGEIAGIIQEGMGSTLGYIAVFASAATFVLLQYASLRLPSAKVMAYTYLTPSWVIGWEILLGRGAPPALVLVGVVLTVVALVLLLQED